MIRRKKKIIDVSMYGFQECKKLWKQETFREFVAEKKKDHDIEKYNIEISILTELRDQLVCEKFDVKQGDSVKSLKKILPWSNMKPIVNEYKKKFPEKKSKSSSIIRFFTEFLSNV